MVSIPCIPMLILNDDLTFYPQRSIQFLFKEYKLIAIRLHRSMQFS